MPDEQRPDRGRPPAYAQAAALGFVTGLRSLLGLAMIGETTPRPVRIAIRLLSVGELIADKMPKMGSRLAPISLSARILSGMVVGYVVCHEERRSPWLGALLGGIGALAGTYGGYHARKALDERLHLPDPVIAVAEDAFAVALGRRFRP